MMFAYFSPGPVELIIIGIMVCGLVAVPIGVFGVVWYTLKKQKDSE